LSLSGNGYGVFERHPNAYRVPLTDAREIIPILRAAYAELRDRDRLIGGRDLTWETWPNGAPRPSVTLVLDELGNMAEAIYTEQRDPKTCAELWNWMTMIAREGRKVGMTFAAAIQEPTSASVDLRFRRNCTRVAFLLGDKRSSEALIDMAGAESLAQGRFIARMGSLVHGAGFAPSDDEIDAFLTERKIHVHPRPGWIDGTARDVTEQDLVRASVVDAEAQRDAKIREMHAAGESLAKIQRDVFGDVNTGGANFNRIKAVIGATTTSNMPALGTSAA
jgi:hypothetical protein